MTTAALLAVIIPILNSVPTILPLAQKLLGDVAAGRGNTEVKPEDLAELGRMMIQTSDDIYRRQGITPPPPA